MAILFYNKPLLRILVALAGIATAFVAWHYVSLSAQKMPQHGAIDALAIISFMVAGWLVMLIAEVIDHHYVRVFGCLAMLLGAWVAFKWIFVTDGPRLAELPNGPEAISYLSTSYGVAVGFTLLMLVILVTRLILDKQNLGRPPVAAPVQAEILGEAEAIQPELKQSELPPIPVVPADSLNQPTAVEDNNAPQSPLTRLTGISGVYLGTQLELKPGELVIGRTQGDFLLENDNQVSRQHARLNVSDDMFVEVTDLGSTNGTLVNSTKVNSLNITAGDVIQIGTTMFKAEA